MKIFNLTKHNFTLEQLRDADCREVPEAKATALQDFLSPPTQEEMDARAHALVACARRAGAQRGDHVLLAGAMYFIPALLKATKAAKLVPTFSFTQRKAVETLLEDGTTKQEYLFKHEGWVTV